MKPFTILWLVLLLPIQASAADSPLGDAEEQGRKQFDEHMEGEGKTLAQLMGRLIRSYDLTLAVQAAIKASPNDPAFRKHLEDRGINWGNPTPAEVAQIREEIGNYVRSNANVKPEVRAWHGMLESIGAPWQKALPHYRKLNSLRPQDVQPKLRMLARHPMQTEQDAEEWLELLKEAFQASKDGETRSAALMIAGTKLPDLARTNVTGVTLAKLGDWLRGLDKSIVGPNLARKIGHVQMAVAIMRKDFVEAADYAMDSPLRAWAPIWYITGQKWNNAEESISKLKRAGDLTAEEQKTVAVAEQMLAKLPKGAPKTERPPEILDGVDGVF